MQPERVETQVLRLIVFHYSPVSFLGGLFGTGHLPVGNPLPFDTGAYSTLSCYLCPGSFVPKGEIDLESSSQFGLPVKDALSVTARDRPEDE